MIVMLILKMYSHEQMSVSSQELEWHMICLNEAQCNAANQETKGHSEEPNDADESQHLKSISANHDNTKKKGI
jgi:hypothetical protein